MAIKVYGATDLIGGGTGAIDRPELDGNNLNDLDIMLFNNATVFSPYTFDAGNATAESSPNIIAPDTNPAAGRWLMTGIRCADLRVDNIKIDGNTISSLIGNILLSPTDDITISSSTLQAAEADKVHIAVQDWNGAGTAALYIRGEENVDYVFGRYFGLNNTSPATIIDAQGKAILIGGDNADYSLRTDAATKQGFVTVPHKTNAEENILLFAGQSAGNNSLFIGGGDGAYNCATRIVFYLAPNMTTLTGTIHLELENSGTISFTAGTLDAADANKVHVAAVDYAVDDTRFYIQGESGNYIIIGGGNIEPQTDGVGDLGKQTTGQWANVWSDLINGADYGYENGWRTLESDTYKGYGKGIAFDHGDYFKTGKSLARQKGKRIYDVDEKPVFAVTEDFIEYKGTRITKEILDKLLTLI